MMPTGSKFKVPVVLLAFNRPDFAAKTLERILDTNPEKIYFAQDGPRVGVEHDQELVSQVSRLLQTIPDGVEVVPLLSDANLGVRNRILSALDYVFECEEFAIVIEDDCLVEPTFFEFAARCLSHYANDERVFVVTAHRPVSASSTNQIAFDELIRIWGWATWSDRWRLFRHSAEVDLGDKELRRTLLGRIRSRTWRLMAAALYKPETQKVSWAASLSLFALDNRLLSVGPPENAVENLGSVVGTNRQDWVHLELPPTKPISRRLELVPARERQLSEVLREDLVRLQRWCVAAIRYPREVFKKVLSMLRNR